MSAGPTRREMFASGLLLWPFGPSEPTIAGARFRVIRRESGRRRYIWIHGNETTARDVLEKHIETQAGTAFLIRNNERNIPVAGGKLDPNRMFSRVGAEKNLQSLNNWSKQQAAPVLDQLDAQRARFLKRILPPPGGLIVALHNNGPAYSVNDELSISDEVAINAKDHPDEFMLCTAPDDFAVLSSSRFNVLLQRRVPPDDDGSLSRLCAARNIRYVNIEAGLGNAVQQKQMLEWLERVLP